MARFVLGTICGLWRCSLRGAFQCGQDDPGRSRDRVVGLADRDRVTEGPGQPGGWCAINEALQSSFQTPLETPCEWAGLSQSGVSSVRSWCSPLGG